MNVELEIPDEVYRRAEEAAIEQRVSVREVLESAVVEHLGAWQALKDRAARGNLERFREVMAKVPDVDPEEYDRL